MLTLLIVDDEPRQVKALSVIIAKKRPDYRIIEKTDAEEAWSVIEKESIDAVLTDIRMPGTDGLALLERIHQYRPEMMTVLISGYAQFDYAKQAIQHGVVEYVVKPIGMADIDRIINALEERARKERKRKETLALYQEHLWQSMIKGTLSDRQRTELGQLMPAECPGMALILDLGKEEKQARDFLASWKTVLDPVGQNVSFADSVTGRIATFVWLNRYYAAKPSETVSRISRLFESWKSDQSEGAVLGASTLRPNLTAELVESFGEAELALRHRFYLPEPAILWGSDIRPFADKPAAKPIEIAEQLMLAVKAGERYKAADLVNALFQLPPSPPFPDPNLIKDQIVPVLWHMRDEMKAMIAEEETAALIDSYKVRLDSGESFGELRYHFKQLVERIIELSAAYRQDKNSLLILKCQTYLQERYMEDISLESVAAMFHFNASYFSNLFKNKTGINFSEYLIDLRVKHAERMLAQSNEKIHQIARKTGFHNISYFNKMFKRKTGVSPNSFRKLNGQGGR
ncbi:response regulator transcription factor [Paenibacillus nanensis]|nr:response regulator [Paenibacillus nanensis]